MSMDFLQLEAVGRLTDDAQVFETNGNQGLKFSIAINGKEDKDTVFLSCGYFTKSATNLVQYLKKGKQVFTRGRLLVKPDKDNPKIKYNNLKLDFLQMLSSGNNTQERTPDPKKPDGTSYNYRCGDVGFDTREELEAYKSANNIVDPPTDDDDIPF